MKQLKVTLIDVGWGDSIFLESTSVSGIVSYGLIDSNDTTYNRSSFIFLKKFFERNLTSQNRPNITFDFILLSHAHADHGEGLKSLMREFGTNQFWYPKSLEWSALAELIKFAGRSNKVKHHQSIDDTKILPPFGDATMEFLWPQYGQIDQNNENNNSAVLKLQLENVTMILAGDAESDVWTAINGKIPASTRMFKVPHHGSRNGTLDASGKSPWADSCPAQAVLGISSHKVPFGHPHDDVINYFHAKGMTFYRTDLQYHLTFATDGTAVTVQYSHM